MTWRYELEYWRDVTLPIVRRPPQKIVPIAKHPAYQAHAVLRWGGFT